MVCYCCQQCAEKYLKALLQEHGITIPHTHDLESLLDLILPAEPTLRLSRRGLSFLTDFAVVYRYSGSKATSRQARAAIRWAEVVRKEIRKRLKLRP